MSAYFEHPMESLLLSVQNILYVYRVTIAIGKDCKKRVVCILFSAFLLISEVHARGFRNIIYSLSVYVCLPGSRLFLQNL